mmetsp:Transcript_11670/g.34327  ORF Transcript_11670/g.34327 Transcript_11670/m.34327 type:complete len:255 (-) Transcript_11670:542-1306(-)
MHTTPSQAGQAGQRHAPSAPFARARARPSFPLRSRGVLLLVVFGCVCAYLRAQADARCTLCSPSSETSILSPISTPRHHRPHGTQHHYALRLLLRPRVGSARLAREQRVELSPQQLEEQDCLRRRAHAHAPRELDAAARLHALDVELGGRGAKEQQRRSRDAGRLAQKQARRLHLVEIDVQARLSPLGARVDRRRMDPHLRIAARAVAARQRHLLIRRPLRRARARRRPRRGGHVWVERGAEDAPQQRIVARKG